MALRPAVLVLTATISPPKNTPLLARNDPAERLSDYCQALESYLDMPTQLLDRVLLIENSDSDLSPLRAIAKSRGHEKKVEIIGFNGNDHDPRFGKGYGEFRMLDYGLGRSSLLSPVDTLWKVIGRLRVLNLAALIRTAPSEVDVYCHLRDVPVVGDRFGGNRWMDLRLFCCRLAAYDRLMRGTYAYLRPDLCGSPENFFFHRLLPEVAAGAVVPRFRIQPEFAGFGGHRNVDYQSPTMRLKQRVRALGRRFMPRLWL